MEGGEDRVDDCNSHSRSDAGDGCGNSEGTQRGRNERRVERIHERVACEGCVLMNKIAVER